MHLYRLFGWCRSRRHHDVLDLAGGRFSALIVHDRVRPIPPTRFFVMSWITCHVFAMSVLPACSNCHTSTKPSVHLSVLHLQLKHETKEFSISLCTVKETCNGPALLLLRKATRGACILSCPCMNMATLLSDPSRR